MNYTFTSSKSIIAKVDHDFGIDNANWISSAPLWVADALSELDILMQFEQVRTQDPLLVFDYNVSIPKDINFDIKRLLGVQYNDMFLRNTTTNKLPHIYNRLGLKYDPIHSFSIRNGFIVTSFESGEIYLYFLRPMLEYDIEEMMYYPYVPDNDKVINAIEYYIIFCILRKGGKHPVYDLNSKNTITNPYLMWEKSMKEARNRISTLDPEERKELSRLNRQFIINHDYNPSIDFDPNNGRNTLITSAYPNAFPIGPSND